MFALDGSEPVERDCREALDAGSAFPRITFGHCW
jgi:hypothetical protein